MNVIDAIYKRHSYRGRYLSIPQNYEVVCILPVGVAENEPSNPKKKDFEERA